MEITLRVKRFDPEAQGAKPYLQDYLIDVPEDSTVLDSLIQVREYVDETLALRCSCRGAICGSCAIRVNGHAALGCKSKVSSALSEDNIVAVEPMGNQPVIKDLVVDLQTFWDKVRAVEPWLKTAGPEPEAEYLASNASMLHLVGVIGCIMCGACVSDCTVMEVDPTFLGPAALAKAYRFVADPRDNADHERLTEYNKSGGIWDCTRCMECVEVCPKGVAPMDRIMALREEAIATGFHNTNGARHSEVFEKIVAHSGRLDELKLPVLTVGMFNIPRLLGFLPIGIMSAYKRKLPPIIHRSIPGVEGLRRVYKKLKAKQETQGRAR